MTPRQQPLVRAIYVLVGVQIALAFANHLSLPLLTLFPMENVAGMQFADTSWVYGLYGTTASIVSIGVSGALDLLPALPVTAVGLVGASALRLALPALSGSAGVALFVLGFAMPVFDVLTMMPVSLALKRFVFAERAGDADGAGVWLRALITLVYALSNGTDVVANVLYDSARQGLDPVTANAGSAWAAGAAFALAAPALGFVYTRAPPRADRSIPDARTKTCALTWQSRRFWRFMGVVTLLAGVRMLFRHLDLTLAIYLLRTSGNASHFPLVQSVNPFLVVCLGTLLTWNSARLQRLFADDYAVLQIGTSLSAAGPLLLGVLSYTPWTIAPSVAAALAVALFSVGEVIWSPRFIAYALGIAPDGSEAVYMALAALPSLAAKPLTSALSTLLVDTFCPAAGATHCNGLWLWTSIGLVALTSPLGLIMLERWLREPATSPRALVDIPDVSVDHG